MPAKPKPSNPGGTGKARVFPTVENAAEKIAAKLGTKLWKIWKYHDAKGEESFGVIRLDFPDNKKTYRPMYRVGNGWLFGDPPSLLALYQLPDLAKPGRVFVVEGEKCADACRSIGLNATTSAHGAKCAGKTDWTRLAGREIVIIPDNDDAGREYANDVSRILAQLSPPAKVKNLVFPDLSEGEDIADWLEKLDSKEPAELFAEITRLADAAPFFNCAEVVGGPVLECLADINPAEIKWLWRGRIPLGRITLLVGRPGEGKSFLTTDMASRVTTGTPWPDNSPCPSGSVILISAEDDPADTIRPRLDAHHADARRVHLLRTVRRIGKDGKSREIIFTLADVAALEEALKAHRDCQLIVIDPIGSFLGGDTDAHRDNEVRSILMPVARLAEKYGAAILVVAHRRKGMGNNADEMALGSRAFTGIARAVWHLSRDGQNKARRLLLPGKNNLAPEGDGLAFTIGGEPARISWEHDPVTMNADDALATESDGGESRPGPEPKSMNAAKVWLLSLLTMGEIAAAKVKTEADAAGLAWRTVQRAADALGVMREKSAYHGGWLWRLPTVKDDGGRCQILEAETNLASRHLPEFSRKTAFIATQNTEDAKSSDSGIFNAESIQTGLPDVAYAKVKRSGKPDMFSGIPATEDNAEISKESLEILPCSGSVSHESAVPNSGRTEASLAHAGGIVAITN